MSKYFISPSPPPPVAKPKKGGRVLWLNSTQLPQGSGGCIRGHCLVLDESSGTVLVSTNEQPLGSRQRMTTRLIERGSTVPSLLTQSYHQINYNRTVVTKFPHERAQGLCRTPRMSNTRKSLLKMTDGEGRATFTTRPPL